MNIIQTNEPCFSIIESLIDSIVLTFWETKEDMDAYYNTDKNYQSVLDRIKPMMEEDLERREYTIFKAKMKESH